MDPYHVLGVSKNFTLQELKDKYKQIAVKVHPDKGGTEHLFLLVTKCFKTLLKEYKRREEQKEYHELKADFKRQQAQPQRPSSNTKFDIDKFNQVFSENKLDNAYDKGYKDWMSDSRDIEIKKPTKKFTKEGFNQAFENEQFDTQSKYIVKYKEPEALPMAKKLNFTDLAETHIDDFSGDNTTKKHLNYMDYKVAHSTSRIVDPSLKEKIKQYRNIEELERDRDGLSYEPDEETVEEQKERERIEKRRERDRREALRQQEKKMQEHYNRVHMLMLGR